MEWEGNYRDFDRKKQIIIDSLYNSVENNIIHFTCVKNIDIKSMIF
jgi:hypothetical protein